MTSEVAFRNPYPIPDVSSEGFWISPGPVLGKKVEINDRRWWKKLDIHERLFAHHTLNSIRKNQRLVRTKEPNDALDLALTSAYAHNEDILVPKMYVSMQPETLGVETWRVLRNELKTSSPNFGIPTIFGEDEESYSSFEEVEQFEERAGGREGRHGRKISARVQTAAGAKVAPRGKKMAGAKVETRSKMAAGTKMPAAKMEMRSKMAAGTKMPAGSKKRMGAELSGDYQIGGRATSAPVRPPYATRSGRQIHQYADRTNRDGIPDRIETIHLSNLKLAIEGPHSDLTKAGYSRKEDGTFYGI